MYKVKNITQHPRKYRDNKKGRDIIILPGKFIETNNPPKESVVWEITNIEKKEKIELNTQEVKNGSSSSRRCMDGNVRDSNIKRGRK
jgi:hypothetical protein